MWNKAQKILNDQAKYEAKTEESVRLDLCDVNLAKADIGDTEVLYEMEQIKKEIKLLELRKADPSNGSSKIANYDKKLHKENQKLKDCRTKYIAMQGGNISQSKSKVMPNASTKDDFDPKGQNVVYTFVTFRSMDAVAMMERAYDWSASYRCCIKAFSCCCTEQNRRLKMREVDGRWPKPQEAELPDNILWQNMGYSRFNQLIRKSIVWLIAISLTICAFIGILYFKNLAISSKGEFKAPTDCPVVSMIDAISDQHLDKILRQGKMHCYCFEEMKKALKTGVWAEFLKFLATKFTEADPNDDTEWCRKWFDSYSLTQAVKVGAPMTVVTINVIVTKVFEALSKFEKHYTKGDQTISTFIKITILQYFNIAVIAMLANFQTDMTFIRAFGILNGQYSDFTVGWYRDVGAALCFTLFLNTGTPHAAKVGHAVFQAFLRCFDRGCKSQIRRTPEGDEVNTKKFIQQDVEKSYTGKEIESYFVYA